MANCLVVGEIRRTIGVGARKSPKKTQARLCGNPSVLLRKPYCAYGKALQMALEADEVEGCT